MTNSERRTVTHSVEHAIVTPMLLDRSVIVANPITMDSNQVVVVRLAIALLHRTAHNVTIILVNVDANQVLLDVSVIAAYQAIGITLLKDAYVSSLDV